MTPPNCPKCGDNRQVWANQITGRMTCHRIDCHTEIETMTKQTAAQRLAKALSHEYSTVDESAAAAELLRLEAENERLKALAPPARQPLTDAHIQQLILMHCVSNSTLEDLIRAVESAHGIGETQ